MIAYGFPVIIDSVKLFKARQTGDTASSLQETTGGVNRL
jgi:hypothetical protein